MELNNKLRQVSIQLVDDKPLLSDEVLNTPDKIVEELTIKIFSKLDREEICIINFDSAMHPINFNIASVGTLNNAMFHPRELIKSSVLSNAANVIMLHNHPSGNLKPSAEDVKTTERACKVYSLLGINLLDHIIVGGYNKSDSYSFSKEKTVDFNNNHFDDVIFKPLSDKLIKSIDIIQKSEELQLWHNRQNEVFKLTNEEAELLLDYEDMNSRAFIVECDELKFVDVETDEIKECDLYSEIKELRNYVLDKLDEAKRGIKGTNDFVEYCDKVSQIDDLKILENITSGLLLKTQSPEEDYLVAETKSPEEYCFTKEITEIETISSDKNTIKGGNKR